MTPPRPHDNHTCKECGAAIDREYVSEELRRRTGDIPETCNRAAEVSVYCGLDCALLEFSRDA